MAYKQALITGATSGIGMSFARALPNSTDLVLTGRNKDALLELQQELRTSSRNVDIVSADLAAPDGLRKLLQFAAGVSIDLLINNAGLGQYGAFLDNSPDIEAEMVSVNVMAPVILTRALLPGMLQRATASGNRAGLIFLASVVGFRPVPFFSTYAATKAFDLNFAEGLYAELRREPIDVLALCPGATRTGFFERAGVQRENLPFVIDSDRVAREGLAALGRKPVLVTDPFQKFFLWPSLMYRRLILRVTEKVMQSLNE